MSKLVAVGAASAIRAILTLRGHNVLLDHDLAVLYGVSTREIVQAVARNPDRFPGDFVFRLTAREVAALRSQSVMPTPTGRGGRRGAPYAFTEEGVAMLSSVLRGSRATRVNISIMRAFVRLRRVALDHAELARTVVALEKKYDGQFRVVFDAIRRLMLPPSKPKRPIGFR